MSTKNFLISLADIGGYSRRDPFYDENVRALFTFDKDSFWSGKHLTQIDVIARTATANKELIWSASTPFERSPFLGVFLLSKGPHTERRKPEELEPGDTLYADLNCAFPGMAKAAWTSVQLHFSDGTAFYVRLLSWKPYVERVRRR